MVIDFAYTDLQRLPFSLFHFICNTVLHRQFYYFAGTFLYHILYHFSFLYFSVSNQIAMSAVHIRNGALTYFVELFDTAAIKANFYSFELSVKMYLEYIVAATVSSAKERIKVMDVKDLWSSSSLRKSQFLKYENLARHELRGKRICRPNRASLAVYTYGMKNGRIQNLFFHIYLERNVSITLLNSVRFMQFVLDNIQTKAQIQSILGVTKTLKA